MENQRFALDIYGAIDAKESLFFHGPGGTGKTYAIRDVISRYNTLTIPVLCPTGKAAVEIGMGAQTINRYFGIKPYDVKSMSPLEKDAFIRTVVTSSRYKKNRYNPDVIVIDEISMVGAFMLRIMDAILRDSHADKPMGGKQLILSGDFYQLPPVKDDWCFTSPIWKLLDLQIIEFKIGRRYTSPEMFEMLLRIRRGQLTDGDKEIIKSRNIKPVMDIIPAMLYPNNREVEAFNNARMRELSSQEYVYDSIDTREYHIHGVDMLQDHSVSGHVNPEVNRKLRMYEQQYSSEVDTVLDDLCPKQVTIKIGCKILICRTYNADANLVNGTVGKIISINTHPPSVLIETQDGCKHTIEQREFKVDNPHYTCSRKQYPFKLGWAITIHKSQGMTLDSAIIQLEKVAFNGQAYVAISRVRDINRLYVAGNIDFTKIKADPTVLAAFA